MPEISPFVFTEPLYCEKPSAWNEHTPFAFFLIEQLRPRLLVELGTQFGNSYFTFCQAIDALKLPSKAYGVDIWLSYSAIPFHGRQIYEHAARINNRHFSHFSNLLKMTFDEALPYFREGSIDLLHIDGMHDYVSVKHDFESWLPKMSDQGVIIFHDSAVRDYGFGVWKLMEELMPKYPSFSFPFGNGLTVVCTGSKVPEAFLSFVKQAGDDAFTQQLFKTIGTQWALQRSLAHLQDELRTQQNLNTKLSETIKENNAALADRAHRLSLAEGSPAARPKQDVVHRFSLIKKWRRGQQKKKNLAVIENSPLFDGAWYLKTYPDVEKTGLPAAKHYLQFGGQEGRNPSASFDSAFYLEQNADVKASGMNPLLHFERFGRSEKRKYRGLVPQADPQ